MSITEKVDKKYRPLFGQLTHILNHLILGRAGRGSSSFAVIHHQGRRSGRAYATPVSAWPTADGFLIPLTFGQGADWFQNIQAAGECDIQWQGTRYRVTNPQEIDRATARLAFLLFERAMLQLIGVEQFVRVRYAATGREQSAP